MPSIDAEGADARAFISTVPASRKSRRFVTAAIAIAVLAFGATLPFLYTPLPRVPAFIPAIQTSLAIIDFVTMVMLLGQFLRQRCWAILTLASGYLFTALLVAAHTLSFPGVFAEHGAIGGGTQTTSWIYVFWHAGLPLFVIAYALMSRRENMPKVPKEMISRAVVLCFAAATLAAGALVLLATAGMDLLPLVTRGSNYSFLVSKGISPALLVITAGAMVALSGKKRPSLLNLWLLVVMCVWLCDVTLSAVFSSGRYAVGWYAGRIYSFLAAGFLLSVLLIESNKLQSHMTSMSLRLAAGLRKDRARLMEILDQAPLLVGVRDLHGRLQMVNSHNGRWVEANQTDWRGKTVREIFGDGDFADRHDALHEEVLSTGKPVQGELIMPNGNDPRTLLCVKFPLYDAHDQIEQVGSVAIDITEQRRLHAAMERIFTSSIDLILVVNSRGDIIQVSPSSFNILGYTPEEMAGQNAIQFIHPDDLDPTREEMRIARKGGRTRNFETRYVHKEGRPVMLSWTGVWSQEARQHFYIGRDMTERQKMEQELRHAQKMEAIGQLTGGIAHDYNNLLTVILGNTEILAELLRDKPELHSLAQLALEAADRSATLTQRLLAFGRRQALESKPTDVNELLTDMTDLMIVTVGEQVKLDLRLGENLWTPKFDRNQFETAILNLAVNARDAMANGGRLTIETSNVTLDDDYVAINPTATAGEYVGVTVTDTGAGMNAETLARVFEPFFTTKEVGKGTGLGLSMIYGFVRQSGGHITIYSEPGRGTVVRLYFPRTDAPSIVPALRETVATPQLPTGHESILLVEDDPLVRAHTEKQLIALGYRVQTADKGSRALELLDQGLVPDLLFTDVVMPDGMNGWQLADETRRRLPGMKVLFTSGYTHGTIAGENGYAPGTEFLGKPFRRAELAAKLRELLNAEVVA
ncbi:MAG TPA: MASE4 domain-containing protein [Xanthobacteraceae bacterium]|nr:MASE4 domain-containing protein [Xanthobacteraceae bacterium]